MKMFSFYVLLFKSPATTMLIKLHSQLCNTAVAFKMESRYFSWEISTEINGNRGHGVERPEMMRGKRKLKIYWSVALAVEVKYKCSMNIHQIYNLSTYSMNYSIV